MELNSNNYSAQAIVSNHESVPNELQPAKPSHNPPLRTPFKIRKQTTIGFERAEWEQAQKNAKQLSVQYYKDEIIPFSCDLSHFRIYGPGIFLFFHFAKKVIFLFIALALIALIPTVYNAVVGEGYTTIKSSLSKYLGLLSIGNHQPFDQEHTSLTDKLMNTIPAFFCSLFFFAFYVFWSRQSDKQIEAVRSAIKLISYKAVQVVKFPKDVTEQQVLYYMSQFGEVKEVSTVRNYKDTIYYCRKIYEKTLDAKQILLEREKNGLPTDQQFQKQISQREAQLEQLYQKLSEQQQNSSKQPLKFFVTFQSPQQRQRAVDTFHPYLESRGFCLKKQYPEELKAKGQEVLVRPCHTEPAGIIWQNVHITWKTRWIRLLLQILLILIVIFLGFCFILILNVLNPPITTSNIDSSMYNHVTILFVTDQSIVRSWCLNNNDLIQASPGSDFGVLCQKHLTSNVSRIMISIAIAFAIMAIKYVLKYTVLYLSKFMRYKTHTQESIEMTKNLFLTYFFSTVFITIFMQARFSDFSPKQLVKYISSSQTILMNLREINDFGDITHGWYLDVGYQIWITWFILAITSPLLIFTYHYPLQKLSKYLGSKQVLQRKMEKYLMPQQFQIHDHYANLALFLFVGFVFSPGMPSLIILTAAGLVLRYIYLKFVFIRFSKIPKPIDESLNTLMMRFMLLGLFCHLIMAICMYGVQQLFDQKDSFLKNDLYGENDGGFKKFWMIVFRRCVDTWYLTGLLAFYLFYFFLWRFIRDVYRMCRGKRDKIYRASPQMLKDTVGNGGYVSGIESQRSLTKSYKIENNPDYFDILAIIERRQLATTLAPPK